MSKITWEEFEKVELMVGTIIDAQDFPEARKPSYKLEIDLGKKIGVKKSSAQITKLYNKEELLHKQVVCVTNFPPKQIANFVSEVLTTGFIIDDDEVVLTVPNSHVPNGTRLA